MALQASVESYIRNYVRGNKCPCWTMDNEQVVSLPGATLTTEFRYGYPLTAEVVDSSSGMDSSVAKIDNRLWNEFWNFVDGLGFAPTQYRRIKLLEHWRGAHDVKGRYIYYEEDGVVIAKAVQDTVVCKGCHVVMTLEAATIDHRRPQTGGEMAAAYKLLRAIGLCKEKPTGKKGSLTLDLSPFKDKRDAPAAGDLTWFGVLLITCIHTAGQTDAFGNACVHHFINLQPMCFRCNSQKGNWGY